MNEERLNDLSLSLNAASYAIRKLSAECQELKQRIAHLEEREGVEWTPTTDDGSGAGQLQ